MSQVLSLRSTTSSLFIPDNSQCNLVSIFIPLIHNYALISPPAWELHFTTVKLGTQLTIGLTLKFNSSLFIGSVWSHQDEIGKRGNKKVIFDFFSWLTDTGRPDKFTHIPSRYKRMQSIVPLLHYYFIFPLDISNRESLNLNLLKDKS